MSAPYYVEPLPRLFRKAACIDAPDPGVFHNDGAGVMDKHKLRDALRYCEGCEIAMECFAYAKRNKMCGVWGGVFLPVNRRS